MQRPPLILTGVSGNSEQTRGGISPYRAVTAAESTHTLDHGELPEKLTARNDRRTRFKCPRE